MTANRSLVVISAGLSVPSTTRQLADSIAAATQSSITSRGETSHITVIELRELAGELAQAMTAWGSETPMLSAAHQAVDTADGLIAVSPIFQASYSGLFKMFFDTLEPGAMKGLPTLIAATAGSARHSLALDYSLRPLMTYLKALVVPTGIFQATEDFGGPEGQANVRRIERAANELANLMVASPDYVHGLRPQPTAPLADGPPPEAKGFVPLHDLLHGEDTAGS